MAYFFFSIDHKSRGMRSTASLGRWFLMFAFGAMFGSTVMARMALFIGRLDFITNEWGPVVPLWFWIAGGAILVLLGAYLIFRPKPPKKLTAESTEETGSTEVVTEAEPI
jgi:small neutral amino acid transporter SnatA (MarC family)